MKTKSYPIMLILFLVLSSCAPVSYINSTKTSDKKEMKSFLKGLEKVALSKHYTLLMDYMDPEFISNGHEIEFNGDDLIFVDEIFTGYDISTKTYHCIHQKDIISFETLQVNQINANLYKGKFTIGDIQSVIDCYLFIKKSTVNGQTKFGILGSTTK
jgi:hypothetical protein